MARNEIDELQKVRESQQRHLKSLHQTREELEQEVTAHQAVIQKLKNGEYDWLNLNSLNSTGNYARHIRFAVLKSFMVATVRGTVPLKFASEIDIFSS